MPSRRYPPVQVGVDPELLAAIKAHAADLDLDLSKLTRKLYREELERARRQRSRT